MKFKEVLNKYLKELNCSSKKLSNESGLSESVICRYRNGKRIPTKKSEQLNKLTTGIFLIAEENNKGKFIIFDASHISRIRYGKAKPSNPIEFSNKICSYIFTKYNNPEDISNISTIIGCKKSDLSENKFINTLFFWLTSETKNVKNEISDFLYHLDSLI